MKSTPTTWFRPERDGAVAASVILAVGISVAYTYAIRWTPGGEPFAVDFLRHFLFIPIVLAAIRLGLRWGLTASLTCVAALLPYAIVHWEHNDLGVNLNHVAVGVLYVAVAGLTGCLSDRLQTTSCQLRDAYEDLKGRSEELTHAYAQLRKRTKQVFEWQEHARRADKFSALGLLTAGLAHEIRNPLGSINGAAQILRDRSASGERELFDIVIKETERLNSVIENFLTFARKDEPPSGSADLDRAVAEVLAVVQRQAGDHQIDIVYKPQTRGLKALAPHEHLRQVILNIVLNAIQAVDRNGAIGIAAHETLVGDPPVDGIRLVIEDTGPGVAPELAERIFDPFFTTHPNGGGGLGLAIVQRILMDCGGQIQLDRGYTEGARFVLTLTAAKEPCPVRRT